MKTTRKFTSKAIQKPFRPYKCAFLCASTNTAPSRHEIKIAAGTKDEMEEFSRGFHKGRLMGSEDACRRMLNMEKMPRKKTGTSVPDASIFPQDDLVAHNQLRADSIGEEEEPLHDHYIQGMAKALLHWRMFI